MPKPTLTVMALSIALIAATAAVPPQIHSSGVFDTPTGAMEAGPLRPGDAYEFTVSAEPGQRLSFATMLVPSNDLFYAPSGEGIPLFDEMGRPTSGDVTSRVRLWDAGTERNRTPGTGEHQGNRQGGPDRGPADDDDRVRRAGEAGMAVPPVDRVLRLTVMPAGETMVEESGGGRMEMEDDAAGGMQEAVRFTVRIENRSDGVMVPAAGSGRGPGVPGRGRRPGPAGGEPSRDGHGRRDVTATTTRAPRDGRKA